MSWVPRTDFEEEIVSSQPDHNFIYGQLEYAARRKDEYQPRPQHHLDLVENRSRERKEAKAGTSKSHTTNYLQENDMLDMIGRVHKIAGTKPLGQLPALEDWDSAETREKETVAMMRHFGGEPLVDRPFDENATLATWPIPEGVRYAQNGRKCIPIFFDSKYFELKRRNDNGDEEDDYVAELPSWIKDDECVEKIGSFNFSISSNSNNTTSSNDIYEDAEGRQSGSSTTQDSYKTANDSWNQLYKPQYQPLESSYTTINTSVNSSDSNNSGYQTHFPPLKSKSTSKSTTSGNAPSTSQPQSTRQKRPNQKERYLTARRLYETKHSNRH